MNGYINAKEAEGFKALVNSCGNILIISHTNPDGDAVGSVVAMRNYLHSKGISSTIVLPNDYPDYLEFLDDREKILIYKKDPQKIISLKGILKGIEISEKDIEKAQKSLYSKIKI